MPPSSRVIFSIEHWRLRRMLDLRACRGDKKLQSIRRHATKRSAHYLRSPTATRRAMAHLTLLIREPVVIAGCGSARSVEDLRGGGADEYEAFESQASDYHTGHPSLRRPHRRNCRNDQPM